jgi:hypothetical protein
MEFVYVPVPPDRVKDVYRLLSSDAQDELAFVDPALIRRMYRESDEAFRKLLGFLSRHPDEPIDTKRLAKALKLERGTASLAGMLGAFGRRSANRYGGVIPFRTAYNPVRDSNELTMPRPVAEVIRGVRAVRVVTK